MQGDQFTQIPVTISIFVNQLKCTENYHDYAKFCFHTRFQAVVKWNISQPLYLFYDRYITTMIGWTAIADALDCKIKVTREKKSILDCLEDEGLGARLTLKDNEAQVHVLKMNELNLTVSWTILFINLTHWR